MEVIAVSCAACGHAMKFASDKAGRKAKCPRCEAVLTVPTADQVSVPAGDASNPGGDEGDGAYGLVIDTDLEARRQRVEEEDRLRQKELRKKKAPKIKKKFKSLPEADEWEKVHFGTLFIFLALCVWAFSHLLLGMWAALGTVEFTDWGRMVVEGIDRQALDHPGNDPIPEDGRFWEFSQFNFLVGIAAGRGFVTFAKFCIVVGLVLFPIQSILFVVGYILCLPVPRHHGSLGALITLLVFNAVNGLIWFFFKFLPIVGLYRYYLIPYMIPEVMYTEYNIERIYPIFMLWSPSPFWESILSMVLMLIQYLEPIILASFVWSCARALKATRVEANAHSVALVGISAYYFWLSYLMISVCGTTTVLIVVLRVLYILWYAWLMMFIVRSGLLVWRFRDLLDSRLNPGG